jgi:hypothetical protein
LPLQFQSPLLRQLKEPIQLELQPRLGQGPEQLQQ